MAKNSDFLKIVSNYGGRLWGLFSVFLFIPYYIRFLGMEAYAVIGFYSLLLGIISFADAGLSSAITREFAANNTNHYRYNIFVLLERKYQIICLLLVALIVLLSSVIANKWLTTNSLDTTSLIYFIRLIGVGVSIQLISSFYFGALFGLDKQVQANLVQFIWSVTKSALVILVLIWYKPTLEVFFVWQIVCNFFYVFYLRFLVLKNLKKNSVSTDYKIEKMQGIPKETLHYIGGMSLVAIISSINVQADKILVSSFFSLKEYGYYSIASVLAQLPLILATPLAMTLFPIFSKHATNIDSKEKLYHIFKKSSYLSTAIIVAVAMSLILYCKELLFLWTKNAIEDVYLPTILLVIRILTIGTTFLALQLLLYYVLLSFGKTKYTVYQGVFQISLGIPMLYFSTKYFGMIGATVPWLLINLGSFIYLIFICSANFIPIQKRKYLLYLILIPTGIVVLVYYGLYIFYTMTSFSFIPFIVLSGIVSLLFNLILYNKINGREMLEWKHFLNFEE